MTMAAPTVAIIAALKKLGRPTMRLMNSTWMSRPAMAAAVMPTANAASAGSLSVFSAIQAR